VQEKDDPIYAELRRLAGQHEEIVYGTVNADIVAQFPYERQLFAKANPVRSLWEMDL